MTLNKSDIGAPQVKDSVAALFADYCWAFEARDVEALSSFFSYPILLANGEGEQRLLHTPTEYMAGIEPLLALYRELGVEIGIVLDLEIIPLAPSLVIALVHWELAAKDNRPLYQHRACYTLARKDDWRITAIALNELPKLREALRLYKEARGQSR